jgi:hypothetical protein
VSREGYTEKRGGNSQGGLESIINDLACRMPTTVTRTEVMDKIEKCIRENRRIKRNRVWLK